MHSQTVCNVFLVVVISREFSCLTALLQTSISRSSSVLERSEFGLGLGACILTKLRKESLIVVGVSWIEYDYVKQSPNSVRYVQCEVQLRRIPC